MKQSELKQFIKGVVREALNERCGGGHLAGGKNGKRMFKHIKQGYKGEKSPEDAKRIAAATVNKELNEDATRKNYETSSSIPKGSLAKLNPKIAQKGSKPTMKLGQKPPMLKKVKEAGMTPEHDYDEGEEIKLIKVMQKIAEKLADMHKGEKSEMDEASYKVVAPCSYTNAAEDKALKIQTEPDVNENHKVQACSYKTVNDQDNDPKNVRDPKVP